MSKEDARAAQRKLRMMNRQGALLRLTYDVTDLAFLVDSIYVLSVEGDRWHILWVNGGGDFTLYDDSPCGSVHDWPLRNVRIVETRRDRHDGEQCRVLTGTRYGGPDEIDLETVTISIADPDLIGRAHYDETQKWRRHRAGKRDYYERGMKEIIRRARLSHPEFDYDFIMG